MNIENKNTYINLKKDIRFNSSDYQDIQVIDLVQKTIKYAYDNFKDLENTYEGYEMEFEPEITDIALSIDSHLQKNVKNKKSKIIQNFVLNIINTEEYGRGRSGFIFLLYILKMDHELKDIATRRKDFWETPRIQFQLLYALYRRRIRGFEKEAETLITNYPKETELRKYSKKYIEQATK